MMRALALVLCMLLAPAARADDVAMRATQAAADLQTAVDALQRATGSRDRVAALTQTIRAYEDGLATMRAALRQVAIRSTALTLQFEAKREEVATLLGILAQMETEPGPLLLLHPTGPLGTVRSGMMLSDITPALQKQADTLKAELQELQDLRALQAAAGNTLQSGLAAAQAARTVLSQAISDRTTLPKRFTEDPAVLRGLLESADTLQSFASGLTITDADTPDFAAGKGSLPLPVIGTVIRRPDEADAAGVRRPGITVATSRHALVTAPHAATIRYLGPLLDYGNVMILEPGGGYLIVLAGLETVYGEVGEVVPQGAALGLMGGPPAPGDVIVTTAQNDGGARETETLYVEIRQGPDADDPTEWFAGIGL